MIREALEKVVKEVLGLEMSKTILVDECVSVGNSLYGALLKGCFPIKNFNGIYHLKDELDDSYKNEMPEDAYNAKRSKLLNKFDVKDKSNNPPWQITPEPITELEVRFIVWETEDMEMMDAEGTSDIYVVGYIDQKELQKTDNGKSKFSENASEQMGDYELMAHYIDEVDKTTAYGRGAYNTRQEADNVTGILSSLQGSVSDKKLQQFMDEHMPETKEDFDKMQTEYKEKISNLELDSQLKENENEKIKKENENEK